jgi:acyl-coenzyme A synthetase/AMP-(fatty) acid ligase
VERVLDEHPAVAESAVVASPDETRGYVALDRLAIFP